MPPRKQTIAASAKKSNDSRAGRVRYRSPTPSQSEYPEDQQDSEEREEEEETRSRARLRAQRAIRRRQAREMELPPHPNDYKLVLAVTQATRKRTTNFPHDDRINKRTKTAGDYPWEWNNGRLEPPPSPFDLADSDTGLPARRASDPVHALGSLARLPAEVRDEVLGHLLVQRRAISVFRGWTLVFPRARPRGLAVAVLGTCRALRRQGLRLLFGANVFRYRMRDPSDAHGATARVLARVFARCAVPVARHGHLLRRLEIRLRAGDDGLLVAALRRFLPGAEEGDRLQAPARLHTLTLDVDAVPRRGEDTGVLQVPVCRLLGPGTRACEALLRLPVQWVRVVARCGGEHAYETRCDLRYLFKQRQEEEAMMMMTRTVGDGNGGDEGEGKGGGVTDVQPVTELWERKVRQAKAQLCNLSWRIETLARDPHTAVDKLHLWTRVAGAASSDDDDSDLGPRSLSHNWREPSLSSSSASLVQVHPPRAGMMMMVDTPPMNKMQRTVEWLENIPEGPVEDGDVDVDVEVEAEVLG
ncbi:hypothetical protein F4775DRAFT_601779 [Biscogniauxia sp. FL1348]|nr:hypothetical protein F4775DRAFT_601779 [Biscogniauxia sp. FL1348]